MPARIEASRNKILEIKTTKQKSHWSVFKLLKIGGATLNIFHDALKRASEIPDKA